MKSSAYQGRAELWRQAEDVLYLNLSTGMRTHCLALKVTRIYGSCGNFQKA